MKPVTYNPVFVTLFLIGVLVIASYSVAKTIMPYQPYSFDWVFVRTLMVLVLFSIIIDVKKEKISLALLGFPKKYSKPTVLIGSFITGTVSLGLLLSVKFFLGAASFDISHSFSRALKTIIFNIPLAFFIAFYEEIMFRGFLLFQFRKYLTDKSAVCLSAFIFATPHFFRPVESELVVVSFISYFTIGCLLGWIYLRSGDLYRPWGLHAGWVFFMKFDNLFIDHIDKTPRWVYGDDQYVSCLIALPMLFILFWYFNKQFDWDGLLPHLRRWE